MSIQVSTILFQNLFNTRMWLCLILLVFNEGFDSVNPSSVDSCPAEISGLNYFINTKPRSLSDQDPDTCSIPKFRPSSNPETSQNPNSPTGSDVVPNLIPDNNYKPNSNTIPKPNPSPDHKPSLNKESICQFKWTNRSEMIKKVRDRMKNRHKLFLRFKVPVFYLDGGLTWRQKHDAVETWVWVAASHDYMLHFPHNFNVLSLGTMGIITNNFGKPGGEGGDLGSCDKDCFKAEQKSNTTTSRCSMTHKYLQDFMSEVVDDKTEWEYVCLQLDYVGPDVVSNPNSAIPELFYYYRFLSKLFSSRPFLGKGIRKDDFVHYHCYEKDGRLKKRELLMNYFVIFLTAVVLWLYTPLLIYYFPSSEPSTVNYPGNLNPAEFHPTYKSPVYFVNLLRCLLCFYMGKSKGIKARVRRLIFVGCSLGVSIRFIYTAHWNLLAFLACLCLAGAIIPDFWSIHLGASHPTHFLDKWEYPKGVFRQNATKKEYQFLAHCMKERIFLIFDSRFWNMLFHLSLNSVDLVQTWDNLYAQFPWSMFKLVLSLVISVFFFISMVLTTIIYHLTPAFYFYKQLFTAIFKGTRHSFKQLTEKYFTCCDGVPSLLISMASFVYSFIIVSYFIVVMMFTCYLIADVTMFTYIGAVLDPSMAFKYVTLVSAILLVLHNLVKELCECYDKLRDKIVEILEKDDNLPLLSKTSGLHRKDCTFERRNEPDKTFDILLKIEHQSSRVILHHGHFGRYLSRSLLDFCIEECEPLRRQILFILVKIFLMTFYISIALWIKNVFHKEKEVSSIFTIAQTIAMYFIPNLLQFLAQKSRLGKKDEFAFHRDVHDALAKFVNHS